MSTSWSLAAFLGLGLAVGGIGAGGAALADDAKPKGTPEAKPESLPVDEQTAKVAELEQQVKEHAKTKALDALGVDLKAVVKLAPAVTDEKLKGRLLALATQIFQSSSDDEFQRGGLKALGDLGEPSLFKHVRPFLAQPNPKEIPSLLLDAIAAAGKLKHSDAAGPLLAIVTKSKKMDAAVAAIKALGNFGENKSVRGRILAEVIGSVEKDKPGVGNRWDNSSGESYPTGRTRTGDEGVNRWASLSGPMVEALNKMTGQNCATAEDWFGMYDRYKKRLDELFEAK